MVVQLDDAIKSSGGCAKGEEGREGESAAYLCGQQYGNLSGACGEYVSVEWTSSPLAQPPLILIASSSWTTIILAMSYFETYHS